jgi:hypothetical protein
MHPAIATRLAADHAAYLRDQAATRHGHPSGPAGAPRADKPAASLTQRLGWALIHLGLRLALPAARS